MSYENNGVRKYVSIVNSLNMHQGSMGWRFNHAIIIKETENLSGTFYDSFVSLNNVVRLIT